MRGKDQTDKRRIKEDGSKRYPLSVIIPIHRSDKNIRRCLQSLMNIPFLDLQILVAANSDSCDELHRICLRIPDLPCITLLNIPTAGKSNAINHALRYVKNEIVLIGDADTYFYRDGLLECLSVISRDQTVVAVTGIVEGCGENCLSAIQKFEYQRIFHIFRPLWNLVNGNLIISGCAGIFRTKCLLDVGLYDTHTEGEDFEITLRLHEYYILQKKEYSIQYVSKRVAKTDVPSDIRSFVEQRTRWFIGFLEVTAKYRKVLLHPIMYRQIFIPYAVMVIFEKWLCFLKWPFIAFSVFLCIRNDVFALQGVLRWVISFGIFEFLFNSAAIQSIQASKRKPTKTVTVLFLTLCLMGLQTVMKDIHVFQYALKCGSMRNEQ